MGCVYSQDQQRSNKRRHQYAVQQAQPQIPRPKVVKRPQSVPKKVTSPPAAATPSLHQSTANRATPSPTHDSGVDVTSAPTEASGGGGNNDNFRRQHFDRNSVLRHSKKRSRKASVGNGSASNTPVKSPPPSNNLDGKKAASADSSATGAGICPSSVDHASSAMVMAEAEQQPSRRSFVDVQPDESIKTREIEAQSIATTTMATATTFSASANVAALLGKSPPQKETKSPTLEAIQAPNSLQQQQQPRSLNYSSNGNAKDMAKGHITNKREKTNNVVVVKKTRSSSVSTPASVASVSKHLDNKSRKTSQPPPMTTPSSSSSSSSGQNGRRALRTRREAAREASEAVNGTQDLEPEEDCGRLI